MPIYEYQCPDCNKTVEVLVLPKDREVRSFCDKCQVGMPRVLSLCNFKLAGKGWGKDGYVDPIPGLPSGEGFTKEYRKQLADPDHPRKVGDILRNIKRKEG